MSEIDASVYVRAPLVDVPSAVALGVSLLSALPAGAPPAVKAAAKKLRTSVIALQVAWRGSPKATPATTKRAADTATDTAWGCIEARLSAYSRLPVSRYPKAPRALEIHSALFETGLDFIIKPYKVQWAEAERRLQTIASSAFEKDIDELAGPEFLAEVRLTQKVYGEVLGVTKAEELTPEASLLEPLRDVTRRIVDHALQLVAWASDDPKAELAVRKALRPIDDQRTAAARRPAPEEPTPEEPVATPATPVPDVPA